MTVLIILATLFVALFVLVPMIERANFNLSEQQMGKWARWILPLLVIAMIVRIIMHYSN